MCALLFLIPRSALPTLHWKQWEKSLRVHVSLCNSNHSALVICARSGAPKCPHMHWHVLMGKIMQRSLYGFNPETVFNRLLDLAFILECYQEYKWNVFQAIPTETTQQNLLDWTKSSAYRRCKKSSLVQISVTQKQKVQNNWEICTVQRVNEFTSVRQMVQGD